MNSNDFTTAAISCITLQEAEAAIVERNHKLNDWRDRLKAFEAELNMRLKTVENREKAVEQVRQIAAGRKAEIEVLKDALKAENKLRTTANGEASVLKATVVRLETEIARLISERKLA